MASIALSAAVSGAHAAQEKINVISNNIANVNTPGFKSSVIETADSHYIELNKAGTIESAEASRRPVGVNVGLGTKVTGTNRNMSGGPINITNQPLDVAIVGSGYLAVTLPNGRVGYTRAGNLKRDPDTGLIVNNEGRPLSNNITIPDNINTDSIVIMSDGRIVAQDPDNPTNEIEVGQMQIFSFPNDRGLKPIGHNNYEETLASGEAVEIDGASAYFQHKALEGSNVSQVEQLTALIEAQREFELNSRVIKVADEMQKEANNIK